MAISNSKQIKKWTGPAILSYGFRPFFLLAALWASFAMLIWILMLAGVVNLPTRFDPVSWHSHEFLFGYLMAVIAGFLLTAVPNWTGRLPVTGWRLGGLVLVWLAGRIVIAFSSFMSEAFVVIVDLSFPVIFGCVILREILAGKNWRNLIVLAMLAVFTIANYLFHFEAARGEYSAKGMGLRLGLAAAIMMISVIGGRIIPSFTRNWLVKNASSSLPVSPMQKLDKIILLISVVTLFCWVIWPNEIPTGYMLLLMGLLQIVRLKRWKGELVFGDILVAILHVAYAFIPLGSILMGIAILFPDVVSTATAQHLWMAGGIGLMTLGVMTRASLGHTGQALHANLVTKILYFSLIGSVLFRVAVLFVSENLLIFYSLSGFLWILAFVLFAAAYGPLLLKSKS